MTTPMVRFERYVGIGDSSTEGLDDPDGHGGYRGWADRLAARIAAVQGSVMYANLAIRGKRTRQVRDEQLERAVAMRPELASVFVGTNDVTGWRFDADAVAGDMAIMQRALIAVGARVITFTLPDLSPLMPVARPIAPRIRALNAGLRRVSAETGSILVDFAAHSVATDRRLWSEDRIHANSAGHARIADALAHALGLPHTDDSWKQPLPVEPPRGLRAALAAEGRWARRHAFPWVQRGLRRAPAGEARRCKRPELALLLPVSPDAAAG